MAFGGHPFGEPRSKATNEPLLHQVTMKNATKKRPPAPVRRKRTAYSALVFSSALMRACKWRAPNTVAKIVAGSRPFRRPEGTLSIVFTGGATKEDFLFNYY